MILRKLNASFGTLDGRRLELKEGLNILSAPNEAGKSTWCAFLCTMLYGLDTAARARGGVAPDKQRYAPWSGAPMAGSMEVEHGGRRITIRRWTEKANAPMQAFSATYTGTDDPVPELTADNAGEMLTGVQREVFERSAFIHQAGMAVQSGTELEKRIHAIVSSGEENVSYSETDKRLRQWQRHRMSGSRGAIPETRQHLAETQEQIRRQKEYAGEAARLDEQMEALRGERTEAVRRMEKARASQRKKALDELMKSRQKLRAMEKEREQTAAECETRRSRLRECVFGEQTPEQAAAQAAELKRRAAGLERLAKRTPPLWISLVFLVLFVAVMAAAAVLPWRVELLCAGAAMLIAFVLAVVRRQERKRTARTVREKRRALLARFGGEDETAVDAALELHETLWDEWQQAERTRTTVERQLEAAREYQREADDRLVAGLDFAHGDSEAAQAGRAVEQIDERIAELNRQRSELEGRSRAGGDPVALGSEALEAKEKLAGLQEQYDALALAIETMAEAEVELQSRFSPELSRRAAEYLRYLTGGRYDALEVARNMTARAQPAGEVVTRAADSLSAGTGDQVYLALRLAVCELALPADEPCPMILDDALVNFDEQRLARALELLRKIAGRRQVLLFSCHEREAKYFENDPAVSWISVGI